MVRRRVDPAAKVVDEQQRQVLFTKRKNALLKKAMELSVLCDCTVAVIVFDTNGGLYQYASIDMDSVLQQYSSARQRPVEKEDNDSLLRHHYERPDESFGGNDTLTGFKRLRDSELLLPSLARQQHQQQQQQFQQQHNHSQQRQPGLSLNIGNNAGSGLGVDVKPAGFLDKRNYPVSPRSENAYESITSDFDRFFDMAGPGLPSTSGAPSPGHFTQPGTSPGGFGAKRFKPLSIVVPENSAQPIQQPVPITVKASTSATAAASASAVAGSGGLGAAPTHGTGSGSGVGGASTSGAALEGNNGAAQGLSSPNGLNFFGGGGSTDGGYNSGANAQSIGQLALDLRTPDSAYGSLANGLDWPSPRNDVVVPGFPPSEDGEGGEVLEGDDLMVTGKSLSKLPPDQLQQAIGASPTRNPGIEGDEQGNEAKGAIDIPLAFE